MKNVEWLFERQRFGIKAGLTRVRDLLQRLDNPQLEFETILVAGTNGKGSTAATLASILTEAGHRAGLFTSPHLSYFGERFVVANKQAAPEAIEAVLAEIRPQAEAAEATFFEIITALACVLFARMQVRYAVLECGMGGQNDATNVVDPVLSLITNVSLDHTNVLGNSVEDIAQDKAGIMRPNQPCLSAATGAAWDALVRHAETIGADLKRVQPSAVTQKGWDGVETMLDTGVKVSSPLIGAFQGNNIALAAAAAEQLGVSQDAILTGVAKTQWAGRLERLDYKGRTVLLDGAHNPAAAQALAQTLQSLDYGELALVFGAGQDKDVAGISGSLEPLANRIYLTRSELSPKAVSPTDLDVVGSAFAFPKDALETAISEAAEQDVVLVAGSLYLVGELRSYILGEMGEGLERWQ